MPTTELTQLKQALAIAEQIYALEGELAGVLSGGSVSSTPAAKSAPAAAKPAKRKKGGMSAEGRARIAAAQKARWAKVKGEAPVTAKAPKAAPKKKGGISAEGRARIAAAQKARWAEKKKAA